MSISSALNSVRRTARWSTIHGSRREWKDLSRLTLVLLDDIVHHQVEQLVVPLQRSRDYIVSLHFEAIHPRSDRRGTDARTLSLSSSRLDSPSLPPINLTRTLLSTYCARLRMLSRFFFSP